MPQSLSNVILHIIFSTKERIGYFDEGVRMQLHSYMASTSRSLGCHCYEVGGVQDHVHLALSLPRTIAISKLIEELKVSSSIWVKKQHPSLSLFSWQRGYAVFSANSHDIDALIRYIRHQNDHHRAMSFMEEYRSLLDEAGVEYDPQFMFD